MDVSPAIHDESVETGRYAPWGGAPYLNASVRKPNFLWPFLAEADEPKMRFAVPVVDSDRARGKLVPVKHEVEISQRCRDLTQGWRNLS